MSSTIEPNFLNSQIITKYIFRFFHIAPVCALSGKVIYDYLFPVDVESSKGSNIFSAVCGVLLIIAGFVNTFLLKPKENLKEKRLFWIGLSHLKLVISLIVLTPLFSKITGVSNQTNKAVKFYVVVAFLIISPVLRFYREYYTQYNKTVGVI